MNRLHRWYCQSRRWRETLGSEILPWALEDVGLAGEVLELGPGPGLTTEWLRDRCGSITCLEHDPNLAHSLRERLAGRGVRVELGDAARMPFDGAVFSLVLSFTMLHHVPSPVLQDRIFQEAFRVLRPGGWFVGTDSVRSLRMTVFHLRDTMVCVESKELPGRLQAAQFEDVEVRENGGRFRFRARRPE